MKKRKVFDRNKLINEYAYQSVGDEPCEAIDL